MLHSLRILKSKIKGKNVTTKDTFYNKRLTGLQDTKDPELRPEPDVLCSICYEIVQQSQILAQQAFKNSRRQEGVERWPHHKNMEGLLCSAQEGCHLCSLLFVQLTPHINSEIFERPAVSLTVEIARGPTEYQDYFSGYEKTLEFRIESPYEDNDDNYNDNNDNNNGSMARLSVCDPKIKKKARLFVYDKYDQSSWRTSSTASEATLDVARHWIHTCRKEHRECSSQGAIPRLRPTRFLKLSRDAGGNICIRLHNLTETDSGTEYVTLSHCWGNSLPVQLLRSNYDSFLQDIPLSILPKTFQDAIDIAIRLGFAAIWIDALCIIQDDIEQEDWKAEAPKMGSIFGNSICSIAALTSPRSGGGCYAHRLPLMWFECKIRTSKGAIVHLEAAQVRGLRQTIQPTSMGNPRFAPILHTRGWVAQERALSPRTLYFSSIGIHWECAHEDAWELAPEMSVGGYQSGKLKVGIGGVLRGEKYMLDWHSHWWELVDKYTRCNLTHASDR
ncbi:MAG: hypothetical protein M1820_002538 [Bogoriella megaspora]|nr:MAG: hypothetical protein M1820_002538 [Bogoriella megaspora]